ncbi:3'-5' exonuclease [Streptomyces sp. NPDC001787]|uniref:3'-5' exonuclease n=1 Tax=Streptomyces sp. NPDC001787 TaxID=3154523 RepID=UPI00332207E2
MSTGEALLNVVDVEATCWDGQPPPGQVSEIIEIGLTVVDLRAGERLAKHRLLVRPARSRVSPFCTELTGLTQAEVEAGPSFAEACRMLATEHRTGALPWASWGDYDRNQFTRQCRHTGTRYPFGHQHTNAKVAFTASYGLRKRPGMARALETAGLPLEGRHHRGDDDAWNIAALVLDVAGRGDWPDPPEPRDPWDVGDSPVPRG